MGWLVRTEAWFQASSESAHGFQWCVRCPHNLFLQHFKNWMVWTQNMPHYTLLFKLLFEIKVHALTAGVEWWRNFQVGQCPLLESNTSSTIMRSSCTGAAAKLQEKQIYHVNRKQLFFFLLHRWTFDPVLSFDQSGGINGPSLKFCFYSLPHSEIFFLNKLSPHPWQSLGEITAANTLPTAAIRQFWCSRIEKMWNVPLRWREVLTVSWDTDLPTQFPSPWPSPLLSVVPSRSQYWLPKLMCFCRTVLLNGYAPKGD